MSVDTRQLCQWTGHPRRLRPNTVAAQRVFAFRAVRWSARIDANCHFRSTSVCSYVAVRSPSRGASVCTGTPFKQCYRRLQCMRLTGSNGSSSGFRLTKWCLRLPWASRCRPEFGRPLERSQERHSAGSSDPAHAGCVGPGCRHQALGRPWGARWPCQELSRLRGDVPI
jgi:hypothetical protein